MSECDGAPRFGVLSQFSNLPVRGVFGVVWGGERSGTTVAMEDQILYQPVI